MKEKTPYTITETLYTGRKHIIYRGFSAEGQRSVILKTLKTQNSKDKDSEQLHNEYEVYRKLNGAGLSCVLKAYGLVVIDTHLTLILEDVRGKSLDKVDMKSGACHLDSFLTMAMGLAKALGDCHYHDLVHKNINPSNLLISSTNDFKIIDFANSTFVTKENSSILRPDSVEGTIAYMSPEQMGLINRAIDYRSDLYSLGVTLYQLLTGQLPFQADTLMDLIQLQMSQEPILPHKLNSDFPEALSGIIMKCLAKEAENRYSSAYGLFYDLEECLRQRITKHSIEVFPLAKRDVLAPTPPPQMQGLQFSDQIADLISPPIESLDLRVASIAHEIKNPLNFIINLASLSTDLISDLKKLLIKYTIDSKAGNQAELQEDQATIQEILEMIEKNINSIQRQGRRANSLIQNIQSHSKNNTEAKVSTDINQMIDEYLTLFSQSAIIQYPHLVYTLNKELDPNLKKALIVPQDIERVFINLLNNSFYSLNKKQMQNIRDYQPVLRVKTEDLGDKFKISVCDNGLGISDKLKEKIFTPFFTTKDSKDGMGLGLSLSLSIVREHDGAFAFETKEGEYAESIVTIPYL